ncbi:putative amidoligase domain-containing protein, partial [Paenibacillus gorillae]|uniref:putative amidoligase domain-containing protein n=1 Tax=Paenibacillus gorillae TaxID=1243662 RepID=UPI0006946728
MTATWVWDGDDDRLERIGKAASPLSSTAIRSYGTYHEVAEGDAVVVLSTGKKITPSHYPGAVLVNEGAATAAVMSAADKERRWRRAGLARAAQEDERLYRVVLFQLEPIELMRLDRQGTALGRRRRQSAAPGGPCLGGAGRAASAAQWPADPVLRRVVRAATSGLYVLGLDIGEADVALGADGRAAVRAARALGKAELVRRWPDALAGYAAGYEAAYNECANRTILIGADPEFVLIRQDGRVAPASRFLGEGTGGAAGSDALLVGRRIVYPVAELRPEPAADPAALAEHVRQLLRRAAARISDPALRWAAGAMPVPGLALGGHIHLSGVPVSSRLLRLLDSFVAFPLALVEDPAGRGRRPRYGALGDFRLQPHGGFEYRTLPSWLVSPAAAKACFALALLCAREAKTLSYIPALDERYVEAFYAGDRA